MKNQLTSNWLKKINLQDSSSEDEKTDRNSQKKEVLYPNLYMIPNEKYPHLQRQYLITKLDLLIHVHKKEENILLQKKIGWNILYSYFFQKLFLISKSEREKNKFLNLKEVEFRIRKQIGKIRQKKLTYEEEENNKEINFDLFEKKNQIEQMRIEIENLKKDYAYQISIVGPLMEGSGKGKDEKNINIDFKNLPEISDDRIIDLLIFYIRKDFPMREKNEIGMEIKQRKEKLLIKIKKDI